MKDNKLYDFLRANDNPYRPYFLRERAHAHLQVINQLLEERGQLQGQTDEHKEASTEEPKMLH